jgi:probable phosphoglycerate mutase
LQNERVERILAAVRALPNEQRQEVLRRLQEEHGPATGAAAALPFQATQLQGPPDYVLLFDGGSQGNPGPGYGSCLLTRTADDKRDLLRLDFGQEMTNNEAEYHTLIAALEALLRRVEDAGGDPADLALEVRGDSALVLKQVEGAWKTKEERLRPLRNRVRELLTRFRGYRLTLLEREQVVRVLGH